MIKPTLRILYVPGARKVHVLTPGDPEGSCLCGRELPPGTQEVGPLKPETPACKRCLEVAASVITVKVPDRETGELIEVLRAPNHFKPEATEVLSENFKRRLMACERPGLIWPGGEECPVEAGDVIEVGSGVSITVYKIRATKGGDHRGYYTVDDDRPALPRRVPPMFEQPETDQLGYPIAPTAEAIAAASIDGNYTQDPKQAVTGVAPEVDIEYRRVLGVKKRMKDAEAVPPEQVRRAQERSAREKLREALKGLDPEAQIKLLAEVERVIDEATPAVAA